MCSLRMNQTAIITINMLCRTQVIIMFIQWRFFHPASGLRITVSKNKTLPKAIQQNLVHVRRYIGQIENNINKERERIANQVDYHKNLDLGTDTGVLDIWRDKDALSTPKDKNPNLNKTTESYKAESNSNINTNLKTVKEIGTNVTTESPYTISTENYNTNHTKDPKNLEANRENSKNETTLAKNVDREAQNENSNNSSAVDVSEPTSQSTTLEPFVYEHFTTPQNLPSPVLHPELPYVIITPSYSPDRGPHRLSTYTLPTTTTIRPFLDSLYRIMKERSDGFFTTFWIQLFQIITDKNPEDIRPILMSLERELSGTTYVHLHDLGDPLYGSIMSATHTINAVPEDQLTHYSTLLHDMLIDRRKVLPADVNNIFDYIDSLIEESEGEQLFDVLEEIQNFNYTTKTEASIVKKFIESFITPYMRLHETNEMKTVLDTINDILKNPIHHRRLFSDADLKTTDLHKVEATKYQDYILNQRKNILNKKFSKIYRNNTKRDIENSNDLKNKIKLKSTKPIKGRFRKTYKGLTIETDRHYSLEVNPKRHVKNKNYDKTIRKIKMTKKKMDHLKHRHSNIYKKYVRHHKRNKKRRKHIDNRKKKKRNNKMHKNKHSKITYRYNMMKKGNNYVGDRNMPINISKSNINQMWFSKNLQRINDDKKFNYDTFVTRNKNVKDTPSKFNIENDGFLKDIQRKDNDKKFNHDVFMNKNKISNHLQHGHKPIIKNNKSPKSVQIKDFNQKFNHNAIVYANINTRHIQNSKPILKENWFSKNVQRENNNKINMNINKNAKHTEKDKSNMKENWFPKINNDKINHETDNKTNTRHKQKRFKVIKTRNNNFRKQLQKPLIRFFNITKYSEKIAKDKSKNDNNDNYIKSKYINDNILNNTERYNAKSHKFNRFSKLQDSSDEDDENYIKANLQDVLRHGRDNSLHNYRRNVRNETIGINNQSSEIDFELTLKSNIYKVLGAN